MSAVLSATNIACHYPIARLFGPNLAVKALDGVSFELQPKQTLAVVGESGCGKSTLAKVLMQIEPLTKGTISLEGLPHDGVSAETFRKTVQLIFQDAYSSINPRKKAWQIIAEPLIVNDPTLTRKQTKEHALQLMNKVGLRPEYGDRYPHMFSGGQRQRIGIARALILRPKVLICDEPVSALDVSIQAQVLNLLMDLQDEQDLAYLFISHDLSVVRHIADEVLVMYLGKVVEKAACKSLFTNPQHPYTQALLASTPQVRQENRVSISPLTGELPSPLTPPTGCAFHSRCPKVVDRCHTEAPELVFIGDRQVACHLLQES